MRLDDMLFWISSLIVVALSYYIAEIDPLVQTFFGGYYGFIIGSFVYVNPAFVVLFLMVLYKIFGIKYLDLYIQVFVNTNLIWFAVLPALYLNKFYDIKVIIIGFCFLATFLAPILNDKIRARLRKKNINKFLNI